MLIIRRQTTADIFQKHQITKEDLTGILQGKLKISNEITTHLPFSKYRDCLIKILVPDVTSEIYSIIHENNLKISEIENSFFQSFHENEILYTALEIDDSSAELSHRLSFSKTGGFSDLIVFHLHAWRYGQVVPKTNAEFWKTKRELNVRRDKKNESEA